MVEMIEEYEKNGKIKWNPSIHSFYSKSIFFFLLFLKRNQNLNYLKVPKFILFEIIHFLY